MRRLRRSRGKSRRLAIKPEELFAWQLKQAGIEHRREFKFHPVRKWRTDFYLPTDQGRQPVIVEIEGGAYIGGRHTRGRGFEADICKYNEVALMGYLLLRGTTKHVRSGELLAWVKRAMEGL